MLHHYTEYVSVSKEDHADSTVFFTFLTCISIPYFLYASSLTLTLPMPQESVVAQAEQTTAALLQEYATLERSGSIRVQRSAAAAAYSSPAAAASNSGCGGGVGGGRSRSGAVGVGMKGGAQRVSSTSMSAADMFMDPRLASRAVQLFPAF